MRFKVIDANSIATIFRTIGEFMPEITLIGTKEGVRLSGVDPARVALIDIFVPQAYFHEYESAEKEIVTVKLEEIIASLKNVKKNDSLTFQSGEDRLMITLDGDFERTFYLPILMGEEPNLPSIKLEFAFKAKMLTSTFSNVMQILGDLGDALTLSAEGGKLTFMVEGDVGSSKVELSEESGTLLEATGADAKGTYGMDYLVKTAKMRNSSDIVELMFGSQLPIKLRFELPQEGYGDFYIAPRAE